MAAKPINRLQTVDAGYAISIAHDQKPQSISCCSKTQVARGCAIATITDWPIILIDLHTEEGIVGRSYLEPYTTKTMRYLVPALHDLGEMFKGRKLAPLELYDLARKSLHFVGYQGQSTIAVSGLDMAAWDALGKAAGLPLCVLSAGLLVQSGPITATAFGCATARLRRKRSNCGMKEALPAKASVGPRKITR